MEEMAWFQQGRAVGGSGQPERSRRWSGGSWLCRHLRSALPQVPSPRAPPATARLSRGAAEAPTLPASGRHHANQLTEASGLPFVQAGRRPSEASATSETRSLRAETRAAHCHPSRSGGRRGRPPNRSLRPARRRDGGAACPGPHAGCKRPFRPPRPQGSPRPRSAADPAGDLAPRPAWVRRPARLRGGARLPSLKTDALRPPRT